uniref:Uncharacterized protein n=1 Tax=Myoviridae sp. ctPoO4 TaxID=2827685 RepID=A0A8S5SM74_9CAUD|nr:MAG TPA: hypothetical protein [Myoviridae sp. ctPoO4]
MIFNFLYSAFPRACNRLKAALQRSTGKPDGYQITAIYYSHISIDLYPISRFFFISFI